MAAEPMAPIGGDSMLSIIATLRATQVQCLRSVSALTLLGPVSSNAHQHDTPIYRACRLQYPVMGSQHYTAFHAKCTTPAECNKRSAIMFLCCPDKTSSLTRRMTKSNNRMCMTASDRLARAGSPSYH
eukprot:3701767-Amphidinium_carterae.1